MSTEPISVAFAQVIALAEALGVENIKDHDGCWTHEFGDGWTLKVNGHPQEVDGVPAFHAYMERKGWPAALFSPYGGDTLGGTEDQLINVLDEAIRESREGP